MTGYFDKKLFKKEIAEILNKNRPEWENCFELITNFRALTDDEFHDCYKNILNFIAQGKYDLYKYPTLIIYFELFAKKGIISENFTELKKIGSVKSCMKK